jgi:hypothetical protein
MALTPKEASDIIEAALVQVLNSLEHYQEGDVLGDWYLIAHTSNPDEEKGGAYSVFLANGHMPDYRLQGLLKVGQVYSDMNLMTGLSD